MSAMYKATRPSAHIAWHELACKDEARTPYPPQWEYRALELAMEFERIRAAVGAPIRIGSAYRTPAHNKAIGGSKESQHMEGRALDLYPPTGMSIDRFYGIIREIARQKDSKLHGLGKYPVFIHIDTRPSWKGHMSVWHGKRAWAETKET